MVLDDPGERRKNTKTPKPQNPVNRNGFNRKECFMSNLNFSKSVISVSYVLFYLYKASEADKLTNYIAEFIVVSLLRF